MPSDWTIAPDYTLPETIKYATLVSEFENNVEQRRTKVANPIRMWELTFNNRTKSEVDTVKTFIGTKSGRYSTFTWTNPNDSTEYTVRLGDDAFQCELVAYQVFNYKLTFVEVK
jgi:phage-related protein